MTHAARLLAAAIAVTAAWARAQDQAPNQLGPGVSHLDLVQVTADRFAEPVQEVPSSVEIITADEMRARGVNDLRSALALIGGVSVAPGGDEGPAAAVPGLLGLREVDDFLLLVDGVPAGGAFVPQFATLNLNDIERIEVQRGPAAVLWGSTSFAGTINLIHYRAGGAERRASLAYGSFGSYEAGASTVLAQGPVRASIGADGVRDRWSDPRSGLDRGHLLLRGAADLGGGEARLDFDATVQHQKPASPRPPAGAGSDGFVPIDFNQNPADGKIDSNRFQLSGAYDRNLGLGSWGSTLSLTQTHTQLVQGFLNADGDSGSGNATGFHQRRELGEAYFDTHLTHDFGGAVLTTFGASELLGLAHQNSRSFGYDVPADGGPPPSSGAGTPLDQAYLSDQRSFAGLYAQTRWKPVRNLGLLAGLRLNHTDERRGGGDGDAADTVGYHASTTRLSGSLGADWRVWQDAESDLDDVVLYASYGNSFQPPQIDFGPDAPGPLLRPESTRSYEAGVKADGFDGRFDADLALFYVDFDNQAVSTTINNMPALVGGGRECYKGAELEIKYHLVSQLALSGNFSYNDARYRDFRDPDGNQLAGKRLLLSPRNLAGLGLAWGGGEGVQASLTANYAGRRYLDMPNSIEAQSYTTLDATLGYAFRGYALSLNGYNLGNRRDPVLESELGEGQFYLLPGRRLFLKLSAPI
jgi:outer membrane receptor protein involved in Fe transport